MTFIGEIELKSFVAGGNDVFLRHFLSNNTKLIVKSNVYNSYKQLKSAWVFRFSEAIKLQRPELIRRIKELSSVPDDTWKELYEKTLVEDCLRSKLFNCCMAAFKKEEYEVVLQELLNEVIELEAKDSKTASDYLTIMSYKLLSDFENLDLVEKSCLKLSISGIIDIKSDAYKKQYKTYLPLQLYQQVSSIEPKKMMTDLQVAEFNKVYDECKKILLEDEMMPARMNKTKGMKPQIMYIMWYLLNKFDVWGFKLVKEEEKGKEVARKRKFIDLSENDLTIVVKEVLDAVFADTLLVWKSGEETSDCTKRMKVPNEVSATTTNNDSSMENMMGHRADLILYNSNNVAICLSEFKDGSCNNSSTTQESKEIRCTNSLPAYDEMLNGAKSVWSMDWNGCRGYVYTLVKEKSLDVDVAVRVSEVMIPSCEEEIVEFKQALLNIYELKEQLIKYDAELTKDSLAK